MLRIHREGTTTLVLVFAVLIAVNIAIEFLFHPVSFIFYSLIALSVLFYLFIISFFRNPIRKSVAQANEVVAPADGKVVVIEETDETEYFHAPRKQISIFMSPANVHVNRNPVGGEVKYVKYHAGKYLVAWHPKSSTENERNTVVLANGKTEILFRQIAGIMARRIVNYLKEGQPVKQGDEMGFIKFGSRVDVFLPLDAEVLIALNQNVRGGETVIARLK